MPLPAGTCRVSCAVRGCVIPTSRPSTRESCDRAVLQKMKKCIQANQLLAPAFPVSLQAATVCSVHTQQAGASPSALQAAAPCTPSKQLHPLQPYKQLHPAHPASSCIRYSPASSCTRACHHWPKVDFQKSLGLFVFSYMCNFKCKYPHR